MIAGQDNDGADWSGAEMELLRSMWADGATSGQISVDLAKIGPGRSRSAVIGKTRRLNLERRASPIKGVVTKPAVPRALPAPKPREAKPAPMLRPGGAPPVPVAALAPLPPRRAPAVAMAPRAPHRTCQWPMNDGPPWRFCDCPRWEGTRMPYCWAHACIASATPAGPDSPGAPSALSTIKQKESV